MKKSDNRVTEKIVPGKGRIYTYRKHKFLSVTSVLSLVKDQSIFDSMARNYEANNSMTWKQYTGDAMLTGTYLHYYIACELALENDLAFPKFEPERPIPAYRLEGYEMMKAYWQDFKDVFRPKVHRGALEKFLWSREGYAGRVDMVLTFDPKRIKNEMAFIADNIKNITSFKEGDVWIVDLKSSKGIYEGNEAQVLAYKNAYNERSPNHPANRMGILRLNGNGWEFSETLGDVDTWTRALEKARQKGFVRSATVDQQHA